MRLIKNTGSDRVVDELRTCLLPQSNLDIASPAFSLFAFAEVRTLLEKLAQCRLVIPSAKDTDLKLLGSESDRSFRNRLQIRWLARTCSEWIQKNVEVRGAPSFLPQSAIIANHPDSPQQRIVTGNCPFTTDGLGLTPGNHLQVNQSYRQIFCGVPHFGLVEEMILKKPELCNLSYDRVQVSGG